MEAATPLRTPRVVVLADRLVVDGLVMDDPALVALVAARAEAGDDPAQVVRDAVEIGARVLDRERTGANAEFVKTEFERAARQLDAEFVERARRVAERLDQKVDEVFGPEHGHVTRALERHFGDESSVAVQNRVRALLAESAVQIREDLRKQFTADSEHNPLAGFQRASLAVIKQTSDQQNERLGEMTRTVTALQLEVARLRSDKERVEAVAAEAERGTAKGRSFEEAVFEAVDAIARGQGDDCDAVGDLRGAGGRKGDVVVDVEGCSGPPRGRIVFEAKNAQTSRKRALAELEEAMTQRGADYGVWVVPAEDRLPARAPALREVNGDKLFVVYDPEEGSRLALEVAYSLARARVLMARGGGEGLDPSALRAEVERALGAMEDVRRVKSQLTSAASGIEEARRILDAMAERVRAHLREVDALVARAGDAAAGGDAADGEAREPDAGRRALEPAPAAPVSSRTGRGALRAAGAAVDASGDESPRLTLGL